jgi:hypothetical protein
MPQRALIHLAIGPASSRVSGSRTKSMGDRKKFALAVRRSLVEREFARLIALISRSQKDLPETWRPLISKQMEAASAENSRFRNE